MLPGARIVNTLHLGWSIHGTEVFLLRGLQHIQSKRRVLPAQSQTTSLQNPGYASEDAVTTVNLIDSTKVM